MEEYALTEFGVVRLSDMASIPEDPDNRDYRVYLTWLEDGGTPIQNLEF